MFKMTLVFLDLIHDRMPELVFFNTEDKDETQMTDSSAFAIVNRKHPGRYGFTTFYSKSNLQSIIFRCKKEHVYEELGTVLIQYIDI